MAEQGTYNQLVESKGLMWRLINEYGSKAVRNDEQEVVTVISGKSTPNAVSEHIQGTVKWSTYRLYLRAMGYPRAVSWVSLVVLATVINLSTSIYVQAWTSMLGSHASLSRYGAFLGGYAGMELGFLFSFCVGIYNAFVYSHPVASTNLHSAMVRGVML